jgi:Tol biopolymer transport system component
MSLQPQDRYPSMMDFLEALNNPNFQATIPAGEKTLAAPAASTEPSPTTIPSTTVSAPKSEEKPARSKRGLIFTCLGLAAAFVLVAVAGTAIWYFGLRQPGSGVLPSPTSSPAIVAAITDDPTSTQKAQPSSTPAPSLTVTELSTGTAVPASTHTPTATTAPQLLVDERQIVFVSDRADGETLQLWSMRVAQTITNEILAIDLQQLTFSEVDKTEPEWSPDGSKILYTASGQNSENQQIWVLELSNGEATQLTDLDGNNFNPTWSPDGSKIAFVNFGRFTDVNMIYMMDADGGNRERISLDFQETDPKWTSDMEWLLYVIQASGHEYFFWRNKADNYATPVPFDPATMFGRMGEVDDPALTADDSYMAYTRTDGGIKQIWSVEFSSRGARTLLLTQDHDTEYQPSWSPDGNWIVFTSERDGNPEIYLMTSVGLLQTNLSNSPGRDFQPDWQK